jgi:hypothetical protein
MVAIVARAALLLRQHGWRRADIFLIAVGLGLAAATDLLLRL